MTPTEIPIPRLPGPALARALGDQLRRAGLSEAALLRALGVRALHEIPRLPPRDRAMKLATPTPFNLLLRLFYFGSELSQADAALALGPVPIDELAREGVLTLTSSSVRSRIQLILTGDTYTTNDPPPSPGGAALDAHKVMSVAGTTRIMADVAIRRPCQTALDMGCGSGLLAILAASHATHVVASDFNPAAAAFTSFNAALNGLTNVEAVQGDLFAAVRGRRFDAIISNPPFVISPETTITFRDSGVRGDLFCQRLAREAFEHLAPGGFFQMICDWPHTGADSDADSDASPRHWFAGLDADVLTLRIRTIDPDAYARQWGLGGFTPLASSSPEQVRQQVEQRLKSWTDFYRAQGFNAISTGVVTMRRRSEGASGSPWFQLLEATEPLVSPAGDQLLRLMDNEDLIRSGALGGTSLKLGPHLKLEDRAGESGARRATSNAGFGLVTDLDAESARVLREIQASRTGSQVIDAVAPVVSRSAAESALEHLLRRGVIVRA